MRRVLPVFLLLCLIWPLTAGCGEPKARGAVDLSKLSITMVHAEVNNIIRKPNNYLGKTITMRGPYYPSYFAQTGQVYHYIAVEEADSCCLKVLEFIWNGGHVFPDDYPRERERIELTGVYDKYEEFDKSYYYISVDEITILGP